MDPKLDNALTEMQRKTTAWVYAHRLMREVLTWAKKNIPRRQAIGVAVIIMVICAAFWGLRYPHRAHAAEIFAAIRYQEEGKARELIAKYPECINARSFDGRLDMDPARRTRGWTMLHVAALTCQPRVIETLIKHGADVNAQVRGVTPLDAVIGFNPAEPTFLDVMQFRDGYGGRIPAVVRVLRANGAKGAHYDKLAKASGDADKSIGVQNMDAIIRGLGE